MRNKFIAMLAASALTSVACAAPAEPVTSSIRADYASFIDEMVEKHGFERDALAELFTGVERRQDIIDAITRPAEALPWHRYRNIFLTEARASGGVTFWDAHADTIERAARKFGVAPEIIVAIIGVESNYGSIQGRYPVIDALATLGFDYAPRARFFRSELEHFLLLARDEGLDPVAAKGSYAGAMGSPQFIASSYRAYAVDFDESGSRDLWGSWPDIIGSIANYFHKHRWAPGEMVAVRATLADADAAALSTRSLDMQSTVGALRAAGVDFDESLTADLPANLLMLETSPEGDAEYWVTLHNFFVITRYNRSPLYSIAVYRLAQDIRQRRDAR
ncbi:MAG: lytic murein transglycosylase B [Gammaproteobacteria bacterium]